MVEVFSTSVRTQHYARMLTELIELTFNDCHANFDLEDCDRILRVQYEQGAIHPAKVIGLLNALGFSAEVLSDDVPESLERQQVSLT